MAFQFSSFGIMKSNNNTMCRDGSSIDGKFIESIIAVTSKSSDQTSNLNNTSPFEFVILGVPNITSKHASSIASAVVEIADEIDKAQQCLFRWVFNNIFTYHK